MALPTLHELVYGSEAFVLCRSCTKAQLSGWHLALPGIRMQQHNVF
jgi:hypothetical protein